MELTANAGTRIEKDKSIKCRDGVQDSMPGTTVGNYCWTLDMQASHHIRQPRYLIKAGEHLSG